MKDILSIDAQIDYLADRIHAKAAVSKMTPLQRYMCLITRETPDRIPLFLILTTEWGAHYLGYRINHDFAWDPKKWAVASLVTNDRLESDFCAPFLDIYVIGPDAMGAKVYFHEDSFPEIIEPAVKSAADIAKLKVPDPHKDGRLPVMIEAAQICKEKVGDVLPLLASVNGPFSWAANMRGIYDFLADMKRDPQSVHALLDIVTEAVKVEIEACLEVGLIPFLADATASTYLMSPKRLEEFFFPYYERLMNALGPDKFSGIAWADFATQARGMQLPVLRGFGIHNYCYCQAEEPLRAEDILEAKRWAKEVGALPTINLWGRWVQVHSPKEIEEEVKRVIELTGPDWPFNVGLWSLPVPCPIEHIDAFIRAVKKYGAFEKVSTKAEMAGTD